MKIVCSQPSLLEAVLKVYRAVPSSSPLPSLTGILLQAQENMLTLKATDLDMGIIYSLPVEVVESGETLIPARLFANMVRRLPSTELSLSAEGGKAVLTYQRSRVELCLMEAAQFPAFPEVEGERKLLVDPETLKDGLRKVGIALASEDVRGIFNGIFLEALPPYYFNLVATDTHRLAFYRGEAEGIREEFTALILGRSLNELARLLENQGGVEMVFGENQVVVSQGSLRFYTRLLQGTFPHYRQVIPENFTTRAIVSTSDFLETVERAILMAREDLKGKSQVIFLDIGETLIIRGESPERGSLNEEITCQVEGEPLKLALNGRYLLEALKVIEEEEVEFKALDPLKPVLIGPKEKENYFCLILPIRIDSSL
ncbi:MAG TPA: DNA polymerase III subunit beta [Moorella mulderi]|nr:DNA polymerase III subunit beta [Moorella mulderi]